MSCVEQPGNEFILTLCDGPDILWPLRSFNIESPAVIIEDLDLDLTVYLP